MNQPKFSAKITKTFRSPLGGTMIAIWDKCKADYTSFDELVRRNP